MAETDIRSATVGTTTLQDYSVAAKQTDGFMAVKYEYCNPNWTKYYGYYRKIPELKQSVDALARWTAGKGYEVSPVFKPILDKIIGWGEDSFQSILMNMIRVKLINGDAYAEIIRNKKGTLINLKPLNPQAIKIIMNDNGTIKHYEEIDTKTGATRNVLTRERVFHICNGRVADEPHGISVIESCEEIILARNELMSDWRKVLHRNIHPLKIVNVDTDDTIKINNFITKFENMVKDRENLFLPMGTAKVDVPQVPLQNPESYIRYLESFFYQAVGVPKVILGGSQEYTEASSKIGYLTFEQVYMTEQQELESDIWNQLAIKIKFTRPVSLKSDIEQGEAANTGQTSIQPSETQVGVQRTE